MRKKREGEERRERERRGENEDNGTKSTPLPPDAFPSTKLGNNITPIKGRLGKNTTPTGRGPLEPSQDPEVDLLLSRPSLDTSSRANSSCALKREEGSKCELHSGDVTIYKEAEALGKLHNRFQFFMN